MTTTTTTRMMKRRRMMMMSELFIQGFDIYRRLEIPPRFR